MTNPDSHLYFVPGFQLFQMFGFLRIVPSPEQGTSHTILKKEYNQQFGPNYVSVYFRGFADFENLNKTNSLIFWSILLIFISFFFLPYFPILLLLIKQPTNYY